MSAYIPRKLKVLDDAGESKTIDEGELATSSKPIIILAEPGMGKTWLMSDINTCETNLAA